MNSYTGGKNGSGVYQKIISMMPKHRVYVEGFLGSGAILRNKKPAEVNFGVEIDYEVVKDYWTNEKMPSIPNLTLRTENFINFLYDFRHNFPSLQGFSNKEILFYCDPPYLESTRRAHRQIYRYDMRSESQHCEFLSFVVNLPYNVMISGYDSPLYNDILASWRKEFFQTTNRAGQRTTEIVWCNFPPPLELHDYSHLGKDFRERERIKRKRLRWKNRLLKMDSQERFALMATIDELKAADFPAIN
jgi:site-specific DNA-adenine methylase